ncbi:MAG TPA: hypothetical protein VEL07_03745 [Planctomycetota bacterium]|nr:hypothetical protein [Planctomycetota bacterium]
MRRALLLLALIAAATAADLPLNVACDDVLRPGIPFRCTVRADVPAARWRDGPAVLSLALVQGGTLAALELRIERLGQLHAGVQAVLVPTPPTTRDIDTEPALVVTLDGETPVRRALDTPRRQARAFAALDRRLQDSGSREPLPWLWIEQGAQLISGATSLRDLADVAGIARQLNAWLDGDRSLADGVVRAIRDPVDGWVQPYRLQRAEAPPRAVALLLMTPAAIPSKARWRLPPAAWIEAARAAGVAVVEVYPAGDTRWSGVAVSRAALALADAGIAAPTAVVGVGHAAQAALLMAEREPGRFAAVAVVDPIFTGDAAADGETRFRALRWCGGLRPAHLAGTLVLHLGEASIAAAPWLERLAAAAAYERLSTRPDDQGFWERLASAPSPRPPRELVIGGPGRVPGGAVVELERWGVPGALVRDGDHLRSANVARLRLDDGEGVTLDGRPYREPAAGDAMRKALGRATGPCDGYRDGPFVVVVGSGEHAGAVAANLALANAFRAAWVAHAHGVPPQVEDAAFADADWPRHHLVLVGGPRANAIAERLLAQGRAPPVRWTQREIVVDDQAFSRGEGRAFALCWPHPALDGRLIVLIDGSLPQTAPGAAPLAGIGDLHVGAVGGRGAPAIDRLFSSDWR